MILCRIPLNIGILERSYLSKMKIATTAQLYSIEFYMWARILWKIFKWSI